MKGAVSAGMGAIDDAGLEAFKAMMSEVMKRAHLQPTMNAEVRTLSASSIFFLLSEFLWPETLPHGLS